MMKIFGIEGGIRTGRVDARPDRQTVLRQVLVASWFCSRMPNAWSRRPAQDITGRQVAARVAMPVPGLKGSTAGELPQAAGACSMRGIATIDLALEGETAVRPKGVIDPALR
jgi:hypothetical protein